jgi:hypothetical protein
MPLGATDTLTIAQGLSGEVAEDVNKHIVQGVVHCILHVAGLVHVEGHH